MKNITHALVAALLLAPMTVPHAAAAPAASNETKEHRDDRMAWWREARFGMFIHWGLYAVPADHEWIMEGKKIKASDYAAFGRQFNPEKFDAKAWAQAAKKAGMKYMVITSKHHDGFCLWPTKLNSDWNIGATPFKRDPLKELSQACKVEGIIFCVYYSIMDWHHSDYEHRRAWNDHAQGAPNMDNYVKYMKGQLKELIESYDPGILWFDGEWESAWTKERGVDLYNYCRELKPSIIVNNRAGRARDIEKGDRLTPEQLVFKRPIYERAWLGIGDYGTPEQEIPLQGLPPGVCWESCMTINKHWGYNKKDLNFKSTEDLLRNLIDLASKGGNYLLNVGPDAEGVIPAGEVERIAAMGKWLQVNGEAIYGTAGTLFGEEAGAFSATEKDKRGEPLFTATWNWRCTTKPGKTYIHILQWPGASFTLDTKGKLGAVTKAYMLADSNKTPLTVTMDGSNLTVSLPAQAPDPIASVLVLETPAK